MIACFDCQGPGNRESLIVTQCLNWVDDIQQPLAYRVKKSLVFNPVGVNCSLEFPWSPLFSFVLHHMLSRP